MQAQLPITHQTYMRIAWIGLALAVSALSLVGLVLHVSGLVTFDIPALVLVILALTPWLSLFIDNATLPGGWRLEFRRLQNAQDQQRAELDTIKFLLENTLTRWERAHLRALAKPERFSYRWQRNFEAELTRLLALEFIERQEGRGLRSARADTRADNDLHVHFRVTDRGRDYLARLDERNESSAGPEDGKDASG